MRTGAEMDLVDLFVRAQRQETDCFGPGVLGIFEYDSHIVARAAGETANKRAFERMDAKDRIGRIFRDIVERRLDRCSGLGATF